MAPTSHRPRRPPHLVRLHTQEEEEEEGEEEVVVVVEEEVTVVVGERKGLRTGYVSRRLEGVRCCWRRRLPSYRYEMCQKPWALDDF